MIGTLVFCLVFLNVFALVRRAVWSRRSDAPPPQMMGADVGLGALLGELWR